MTGVPISHDLIERLRAPFPETVVGIKDSAGDIANMQAMVTRFPGFAVLAGADPLLLPLLGMGGAGCITATSNLVGRDLATVFHGWNDPAQAETVAQAQARIVAYRNLSNSYVQMPAIKAMVGYLHGDAGWQRLRPPMLALNDADRADLRAKLVALGATVQGE